MGYSRPGNAGVTDVESSINSSIDEAAPKMSRCGGGPGPGCDCEWTIEELVSIPWAGAVHKLPARVLETLVQSW